MNALRITFRICVSIAIPLALGTLAAPPNPTPEYWGCEGPTGFFGLLSGILMAIQMKMADSKVTDQARYTSPSLNLVETHMIASSK